MMERFVFALILPAGDFDGQGQTRKRELFKACTVLGVKEVSDGWRKRRRDMRDAVVFVGRMQHAFFWKCSQVSCT